MFTNETQVRVRYAETDAMGVVYHGNYAAYFEVGRVESIRRVGFAYKDMEQSGVIMPVIEWHAKFVRPAKYDDLLTIRTMLKELRSDHRIEFFQEVYNEAGKQLTLGRVVLYFMNAATMEKIPMPAFLLEQLKPFFKTAAADL